MAGGQHLHQVYADPNGADYGRHTFLGTMSLGGRIRLFVFLGLPVAVLLAIDFYRESSPSRRAKRPPG